MSTMDQAMNYLAEHAIVEEGTTGNWYYRKWSNGTAECWRRYSASSATFSAAGNIFYRNFTITLPSSLFVSVPCIIATPGMSNVGGASISSVTKTSFVMSVISSSSTARAVDLHTYAIGLWK